MYKMMDIIMLILMIPTLMLIFFMQYPIKWKDRKFIFGIRNRNEFKDAAVSVKIDEITKNCRKQALAIMICCLAAAGLILFISDSVVRMSLWTTLIIIIIFVTMIPLIRGNSEMKSLKSELGIASAKGVTFTDLKAAGIVRVLKIQKLIVPNAVAAVFFVVSLLNDLGIVNLHGIISGQDNSSGMILSGFTGSLLLVGIIIIPIAIMMDRLRTEVISEDSDVNINYNRARKKIWADSCIGFTWINTGYIIVAMILMFFFDSRIIFLCITALYMFLLMAGLFFLIRRSIAVDRRYRKETSVDIDDDDNWILGSFYYNPDDKRLNVEKRVGFGGTVNAAHPAGMIIYIMGALLIVAALAAMGYIVVLSRTPMTVRLEDGNIICRQITDDYKIPAASVDSAELLTGSRDLKLVRSYGLDMDYIQKGRYTVNGEGDCIVFLNLNADNYIVLRSDGRTYYINGNDEDQTRALFEQITD